MFVVCTSMARCPAACTASVWNSAPRSRQRAPSSAMGCTVPISLLANMMLTRQVSGCKASASCCGVISPAALGGSKVTVKPCACSACKVCSTAWCSIWVEMMCRLPAAAPRAAPVYKACTSDSVPPLVKVISAGRAACSTRATVRRASSTSLRACWPGRYNADGLPQASSSAVRMASSAAGQGRVVAALSRYIMEKSSR